MPVKYQAYPVILCQSSVHRSNSFEEELQNKRIIQIDPSPQSVSYTHLDVYKRQGL